MQTRSYEIVGLLGFGGSGKVYQAIERDGSGFRRTVAIKVLHDENPSETVLARFRDEVRILGLLRDRAVVSVEPMRQVNGHWSVVMEYVEGATLAQICRRGAVPPRVAAEIIAECARALHKATSLTGPEGQRLAVLHRDLKPANIQVTASGEVKILDFGIARADIAGREVVPETGEIAGTPRFVAPERMCGIETPAGDIFSVGIILADLIHGPNNTQPITEDGPDEWPVQQQLLSLSHAMVNPDHTSRPTAREMERECSRIARESPGESLRDWAEHVVPTLIMAPEDSDSWVGQCFDATVTMASVDGEVPEAFSITPDASSKRLLWLGVVGVSAFVIGGIAAFAAFFAL